MIRVAGFVLEFSTSDVDFDDASRLGSCKRNYLFIFCIKLGRIDVAN